MAEKDSVFDVRVVERNISAGVISKSDLDNHIKDLKDSSDKADFVKIGEEENEEKAPEEEAE